MIRLAILASGNGTNAQAIAHAVRDGRLAAEIAVIITNRCNAGVIDRARRLGIAVEVIPSKGYKVREEYDSILAARLEEYDVDTIALAGWMRILSDVMLRRYEGRIINIHPAILPSFTGDRGIDDAFDYGVKVTGCTVHIVSPVLDGGPIIIQAVVPVGESRDKLEESIHRMEHLIFPQALQWLSEGRISVEGRKTILSAPDDRTKTTSFVDGCLVSPPLELTF